ncbi:bifunctional phosphoribosyl-AMP cyclohydrolase/phosphoribosyl-ATP diphosphatase HisIE [Acidaminococcus sp. NSJ-142]|jgi:phosphoribosyl-ATP pyrophosphohydrolase/phosphoribosyl-AMP cyclohydrolase|uniref:bifunctional phosphoribosyl-AMP cyclohydrolase/phosphoribosyl-ATP diphosphatase HisIE n=1 Tax=Acidaminococcus TaxID=904 RepID=UPI000CF87056|nr:MULTISPECIES: bifunctional phosphoribosyl-AMP cyclohydrolase/phosphoribosyl-ATP diphosphatase HisIE [Acidaminococcus]MCD2435357.1 bifunctional phosphoribosyl-AMP cyclohydrolase/phosphoribosyl-ATP diphosphatase HisIE [Acidaminococcus hominis]MCH4095746.1 bifunctional phosphoribosyl-AMP cyclohydrolase/phosphoribosyl-ATP diphosphatase HisIE [Acidaminococcus provencensis]RHK01903.1 bifunctional phosphoribosyl-AMP cyclohydrolase/phosphoribosyl-ATP diphosphatase HisIE [Acidaminococcus sp. AM05-11]
MKIDVSHLKFDDRGLIPAIVQDYKTNQVLMLAYMNGESLARTVETGYTWFWSRSRQELWNKGATSGHTQRVLSITYDCDGDTLLVKVEQKGAACHTGSYSCFFNPLWNSGSGESLPVTEKNLPQVLDQMYALIQQKQLARTPDKPAQGQQDWILKKLGEECTRTLLASKNDSRDQVVYEMGDLWYHCLVLLAFHNITSEQMLAEMGGKKE